MILTRPILLAVLCYFLVAVSCAGADGQLVEERPSVALEAPTRPSDSEEQGWTTLWPIRLLLNLFGYATVFIPGYFLVQYFRKVDYNLTAGSGFFPNAVRLCVFGMDTPIPSSSDDGKTAPKPSVSSSDTPRTFAQNALVLTVCTVGLLVSYLSWGLLQERIMKHDYSPGNPADGGTAAEPVRFTNSQFLVFINRLLALIVSVVYVSMREQPRHTAPLYKYSYCSFSNIMSSWFQYEALKFVSFPTQVLVKASKVIPVMLMGKVVSNKTYKTFEYVTAAMLSAGVFMFLLSRGDKSGAVEKTTTFSGIIIMLGYMMFDSFTSNWQGELFTTYKMTSMQMMAGVNLFSCLLTGLSLIEQGKFFENFVFMMNYPTFNAHAILLSVFSATGQLFIYYTIAKFGPVTFVIIMTVRMGLSILLSCIVYHHQVTYIGLVGIFLVFVSLFGKIYWNQKTRREAALKKALYPPSSSPPLLPSDSSIPPKI